MEFQKRALKGKVKQTKEMREELKAKRDRVRNKTEAKIETNYELIFPSAQFNMENC